MSIDTTIDGNAASVKTFYNTLVSVGSAVDDTWYPTATRAHTLASEDWRGSAATAFGAAAEDFESSVSGFDGAVDEFAQAVNTLAGVLTTAETEMRTDRATATTKGLTVVGNLIHEPTMPAWLKGVSRSEMEDLYPQLTDEQRTEFDGYSAKMKEYNKLDRSVAEEHDKVKAAHEAFQKSCFHLSTAGSPFGAVSGTMDAVTSKVFGVARDAVGSLADHLDRHQATKGASGPLWAFAEWVWGAEVTPETGGAHAKPRSTSPSFLGKVGNWAGSLGLVIDGYEFTEISMKSSMDRSLEDAGDPTVSPLEGVLRSSTQAYWDTTPKRFEVGGSMLLSLGATALAAPTGPGAVVANVGGGFAGGWLGDKAGQGIHDALDPWVDEVIDGIHIPSWLDPTD